jgi:hypothetical protein
MAKKLSVMDRIKAAQPSKSGPQSWFEKLADSDVKSELLEIRAAYWAGLPGIGDKPKSVIHAVCCKEFEIKTEIAQFVKWLNEGRT